MARPGSTWFRFFPRRRINPAAAYVVPEPAPPLFDSGMAIRCLVADRMGRIRAELEPQIGATSWRLNRTGKTSLTLAKSDPKATEDLLRFGNLILLEFENGLPDWGGVIVPPYKWGPSTITVTVESGESLFGRRQTDRGRYFDQAPVGYIYRQLIQEANAFYPLQIQIGDIWAGGDTHSPEYHLANILDIFQKSLCGRLSTADFVVVAGESNGDIVFTAHFYERRGYEKPNVVLLEGQNLSNIGLDIQGPIVNRWHIAGAGTNWSADRPLAEAMKNESIMEYGLWEGNAMFVDTVQPETLQDTADSLLEGSAYPHPVLSVSATNTPPARFRDYDIGDSLRALLYSYGFGGYDGTVRVLTREFNPSTGVCALVLEEDE